MIRNVFGYHRPGSHHRKCPDDYLRQHHCACPQRSASLHQNLSPLPIGVTFQRTVRVDCSGQFVIGQNYPRPEKDAILQSRTVIEKASVLDLHVVTNDYIEIDIYAFTENAIAPNPGSLSHLSLMPDPTTRADCRLRRYLSRGMDDG